MWNKRGIRDKRSSRLLVIGMSLTLFEMITNLKDPLEWVKRCFFMLRELSYSNVLNCLVRVTQSPGTWDEEGFMFYYHFKLQNRIRVIWYDAEVRCDTTFRIRYIFMFTYEAGGHDWSRIGEKGSGYHYRVDIRYLCETYGIKNLTWRYPLSRWSFWAVLNPCTDRDERNPLKRKSKLESSYREKSHIGLEFFREFFKTVVRFHPKRGGHHVSLSL